MTELEMQLTSVRSDMVSLESAFCELKSAMSEIEQIDVIKLPIAALETEINKLVTKLT